jgi:hypothetical protein
MLPLSVNLDAPCSSRVHVVNGRMGVAAVLDARAQRDGLRVPQEEVLRSVRIGLRNDIRKLQLDGQISGVDEAKLKCSAVTQVDSSFLSENAPTTSSDSAPTNRGRGL